jgi:hypothetical protein
VRPPAGKMLTVAAVCAASVAFTAGCGGSGGSGGGSSASKEAPPASEFPSAKGKTLQQALSAAGGPGPVVTPAQRVLRQGDNRFAFGVFTAGRSPIDDAQVAIYAAPGRGLSGPAIGPFPARIEDLATEPAFRAQSTASDPNAAKVVYVTDIKLDKPGPWAFGALIRQHDGSYKGSLLATPSQVGQFNPVAVGDKAPDVPTPTVADVGDVTKIDTRVPPDDMHPNLQDVYGKKPVVLLFATPALCQSRICGPVVDVEQQVKRDFDDKAAFIHMEVYNDNDPSKGTRPQLHAYRLPSEPWLYVIDKQGIVRTAIEGAFSVDELKAAVEQVTS